MSQILYIDATRRDEVISESVRRGTTVVLTRHNGKTWKAYKSTFVGANQEARELYLAEPDEPGPEPIGGELVGVSFRRGHKKCLFNAVIRATPEGLPENLEGTNTIAIAWPEDVQELQRRVYQRACPPSGRTIEVRVWKDGATPSDHRGRVGVLEDLSAGGLRMRCSDTTGLNEGDNVKLAFMLRARQPELVLPAVFRHAEPDPKGVSSLGFQFLGLETTREGQETLIRLARTVTDFQRAAIRQRQSPWRSRRPRA